MAGIKGEVWAASAYAVVLLLSSGLIELLARQIHKRSEHYQLAGFRYNTEHDHWVCSQDQPLWPREYDRENRLVRYRAKASACATCSIRVQCTDDPNGREIVRPIDPWPHSEAGLFHRGMALIPVGLAAIVIVVELIRHHARADWLILGVMLIATGIQGWIMTNIFRYTPAGFPQPTVSQGLSMARQNRAPDRWGFAPRRFK